MLKCSMAFCHCFRRKPKCTSMLPTEQNHPLEGCFDCNICLDIAKDPVVTLCGHLYCWPCIYKWFHIKNASLASDEYPPCPVCKAEISHTTVVPLYGRGHTSVVAGEEAKTPNGMTSVPPRPPACGIIRVLLNALSQPHNPYQGQPYNPTSYRDQEDMVSSSTLLNQESSPVAVINVLQLVAVVLGEMYARMFGSSWNLYGYPNSYYVAGSDSLRWRHEMQAEKFLHRTLIFLVLCCFFPCLYCFLSMS